MIRVRVRHLAAVDPLRELASTAQLMASVARGRERGEGGAIQLAMLRGEALALGRYQRLARALATPLGEPDPTQSPANLVRRWTGGHATAYGDGILSVSLILPGPSAWLPAAEKIPAEKLLNRHVRGLLRAFSALGAPAFYPGRDCVTVAARPVAYVSCERDATGVCLVQAIVGLSRPCSVEQSAPPLPEGDAAALPASLADLVGGSAGLGECLSEALLTAYAARHGLALDASPPSELELQAVSEREARLRAHGSREDSVAEMVGSGLFATPIGGLEAFVALEQSRTLRRVRIFGDFIADSAGVAELEEALRMRPADWHSVDGAVERVLGGPEHFTLGLRERQTVTHAVLEAARRAAGPEAVA